MTENNCCSKCSRCTTINCRDRVTVGDRNKQTLRSFVSSLVIVLGIADIFSIIALCFFVTGSIRQSNSWADAWDAYYCSQAVLPASVLVAATSTVWLIGVWFLCFNYKE